MIQVGMDIARTERGSNDLRRIFHVTLRDIHPQVVELSII